MMDSSSIDSNDVNIIISDNERCISVLEKLLMPKKEKKSCFKRYLKCLCKERSN